MASGRVTAEESEATGEWEVAAMNLSFGQAHARRLNDHAPSPRATPPDPFPLPGVGPTGVLL